MSSLATPSNASRVDEPTAPAGGQTLRQAGPSSALRSAISAGVGATRSRSSSRMTVTRPAECSLQVHLGDAGMGGQHVLELLDDRWR